MGAWKNFWKKSKQWKARTKAIWKKLEAKNIYNKHVDFGPKFLTFIQKSYKLQEHLKITSWGKGVIDVNIIWKIIQFLNFSYFSSWLFFY